MTAVQRLCLRSICGVSLLLICFGTACNSRSQSAADSVERGNRLLSQGDRDSAVSAYTEAIRLDPKNPKAYVGRACAYEEKGDFDKAVADYTRAIERDPRDAAKYVGRFFRRDER